MLGRELLFALIGTGATFLATALGAAMVFLFRKDMSPKLQQIFLGFAAGVMTAAAVFSLLMPAIETLEEQGKNVLLPVGGGFALGALFLLVLDRVLPHMHIGSDEPEGLRANLQKSTMLVFAVTLHNIPEGMAVGVAFGALAGGGGMAALSGACMLALGIGLQNFPEGAAVSLPLRREGMSRGRAFFFGQLSGFVEPLSAVLGALLAATLRQALPFLLCFAAGAMLWVILTEMVPESQASSARVPAAWWTILGFCLMTILDVALG